MSQQIMELYAKITADTTEINKKLDELGKNIPNKAPKESAGLFDNLGKKILSLVNPTTLAISGLTALSAFVLHSGKAAAEAARVDAKLEAVLRSTGNAAGLTAEDIDAMSGSLSKLSGVDDEVIKNGAAVLATFTSIKQDAFEPTLKVALDMSKVLGTDLQGSIIQVGKALNITAGDTTAASLGLSALKKSGVSLTEQQKEMALEMVRVGDIAGYQQLVLKELNTEFGGAAEAMNEAGDGSENLAVSVGNLQETIGKRALPVQRAWNLLLADSADKLEQVITASDEFTAEQEKAVKAIGATVPQYHYARDAFLKYDQALKQAQGSLEKVDWKAGERDAADFYKAIDDGTAIIGMSEEAIGKLNASIIEGAIANQEALDGYNEKQSETLAKIEELQAKKAEYYPWEVDKIQETEDKIAELGQAYATNAEEYAAAMNEKFAIMAIEKIALADGVEGFSQAEYEKAKALLETQNIAAAAAFEQQQAQELLTSAVADGRIGVEEYGNILKSAMSDGVVSVNEVKSAIDGIPRDIPVKVTVSTSYTSSGQNYNPYANGVNQNAGYSKGTKGWETVPSGYPNDSYPAMLSSGEKFAVIPQNKTIPEGSPIAGSSGNGGMMNMETLLRAMMLVLSQLPDNNARAINSALQKTGRR